MDLTAIPNIKMPSALAGGSNAVKEHFVDIEEYSDGRIKADMQYYKVKRPGAVNKAYARRAVADKLLKALSYLPDGYSFKIYDAWRSPETQSDIYYEYFQKLSEKEENRHLSVDELHRMARTFVSFPDRSKEFSFVHSSGGAVDLTIVDENGEELDMGCGFDDFSDVAETSYFETYGESSVPKQNRRLLYWSMINAGFTNYPSEWWHYDFGDLFWATMTGEAAIYASEYDIGNITEK